eukprot:9488168-Pyramimonas_sp.AAC.1
MVLRWEVGAPTPTISGRPGFSGLGCLWEVSGGLASTHDVPTYSSLDHQKKFRAPEKNTETRGFPRVWPWETLIRH